MANSKFSGAGFTSGSNATNNSVLAGYEIVGAGQFQNRRWTLAEIAAGLPAAPASTLQQVMTAGSVSSVNAQTTTIKVVSTSGNYSQLTFSGSAPGESATMMTELSTGGGSSVRTGFGAASMQWSTQGVGNKSIIIGPSTFQIRDDVDTKGIEYHSDYSANFTARSLVDKDYVDNALSTPNLSQVMGVGASYSGSNQVSIQPSNQIIINANGTNSNLNLGSKGGIRQTGSGIYDVQGLTSQGGSTGKEWLLFGQWTGGGIGDGTNLFINNYGGYDRANSNRGARIRMTSGSYTEITTGNPGNGQAGGYITIEPIGNDLNLKTRNGVGQPSNTPYPGGNINLSPQTGEIRLNGVTQLNNDVKDVNGTIGTNGLVLTSQGVGNGVEWIDPDAAKAFVTLPAGANASWTVKTNYNAIWNIAAGSVTLSITASSGDSGTLVVTSTTGSITWPANSNWPDATEPTLTANGTDIFSFLYDGTNYYWSFGQNFGA
jgi:hypothetical protein